METHLPYRYFLIVLLSLLGLQGYAQSVCPPNIGFESGEFGSWKAYKGNVRGSSFEPLTETPPIFGRHTIFQNTSPQYRDQFGNFPVNAPNGSRYSVMLGNEGIGGETEQLTYTFTVPSTANEYSLAYNYAVVFENPTHTASEQPMFSAKVYNVTDKKYISCGSFDFTASSGIPGFQLSPYQVRQGIPIFFKPWSTVTINLSNLGGKELRLEFTTQDCAPGGHFGYAYLDVMENCSSPILGNVYCLNNNSVTLRGPTGYQEYYWYLAGDFTNILSTSDNLVISPPPANGTRYALKLVPYAGYGCPDTLYTTIEGINEVLTLNVTPAITACYDPGVNLKDPALTQGSSPNLTFSYFTDAGGTLFVPNPERVIESGRYYIKAKNQYGCEEIKPIDVTILPSPTLNVRPPNPVCLPETVDLTQPFITAGSSPDAALSYWRNAAATQPLTNPQAVNATGTYYIKALAANGCAVIKPVQVVVMPTVVANAPGVLRCAPFNLTDPALVNSNVAVPILTYWLDAQATQMVPDPTRIMSSGTYYIKVSNSIGCFAIAPINVDLYDYPAVDAIDPIPVTYPATVDIRSAYTPKPDHTYSYWRDSLATIPLDDPYAINLTGRYFVKIVNRANCYSTQGIRITVLPSPVPDIIAPNAFSPNGDGLNDIFRVEPIGAVRVKEFKVFNRWGEQMYITTDKLTGDWDGKNLGTVLPTGVYYWVYDGTDYFRMQPFTKSGSVTIIK